MPRSLLCLLRLLLAVHGSLSRPLLLFLLSLLVLLEVHGSLSRPLLLLIKAGWPGVRRRGRGYCGGGLHA